MIYRMAAASASSAPVSRDHTPAQASARRSVGTTALALDQGPLAAGDNENVATSERLSDHYLLADHLRPPVREPEDE